MRLRLARLALPYGLSAAIMLLSPPLAGAQDDPEPPPLPPPGRLIDIGGWRLHLNCTGRRGHRPIVILEAGVGDFSVEWSLVQPRLAESGRVCSYDRGGDGWSDLGPLPRTMHQVVWELHTLLEQAGERPPYVLVGHSYGGWLVRLYQSLYAAEIVGVVLIDGGNDNPGWLRGDGKLVGAAEPLTGEPIPPVQTTHPLRERDIPAPAMAGIRAGLAEARRHANDPPRDRLPPEARQMRTWALGLVKHVAAAFNPAEIEEIAQVRADGIKRGHPFGDLPLVVLTRGLPEEAGPDGAAREAEHRSGQALLATLSRNGRQVIATQSGHHIQLQDPDLVVRTIQLVVAISPR